MGSGMDETKGRIKEAAGALTGDEDLEREGELDQVGATVKEKADNLKDKVGDLVDRAKDALDRDR